jgi:hypothetical protein
MSEPSRDIGYEDQVAEHVRRTLDAMAAMNREANLLLKRVENSTGSPARPGRADGAAPAEGEVPDEKSPAPATERAEPPPAALNPDDFLTDRLVQKTVEIVMDKIQPLLAALEKIRTDQSKTNQLTETEYVTKMCEEMRQRIARRRGFTPNLRQ